MNIVIGKTYYIKQFSATKNAYVTTEAKVVDFIKRISGRNLVVISVSGKTRRMAANVFKSKVEDC